MVPNQEVQQNHLGFFFRINMHGPHLRLPSLLGGLENLHYGLDSPLGRLFSHFYIWRTRFLEKFFPVDVNLTSLSTHIGQEDGPLRLQSTGSGSKGTNCFLKGQQRELRNNSFPLAKYPMAADVEKVNFSPLCYNLEQI